MTDPPVAEGPSPPHEPAAETYRAYRRTLFAAGLLIDTGADGLYGRSGDFESVVAGLERLVGALGRDVGARVVRFPPVLPQATFVKTDYLQSFPSLAGAIVAFAGTDGDHAALLARLETGQPWADMLQPTDAVLCPAACHPLYPTLPADVPDDGSYFDVYGSVFRHEPSLDPARLVSFRMYELVYVGVPEGARAHRDRCLSQALEIIAGLGVDVSSSVANDPFFGRAGRILAHTQRAEELKYEILAATSPVPSLTAVASANGHEDHFGRAFGLRTSDGEPAHTACVGYGVERITLALIWAHGPDLARWPAPVRAALWP
ncbi:MAG: amino acid--[acyl-carrier-protein] ligase [Actinomycetota bacterium]|nr:amino acid--[acyl-carrier-protein] ligase [Actinomycetota bacterium]